MSLFAIDLFYILHMIEIIISLFDALFHVLRKSLAYSNVALGYFSAVSYDVNAFARRRHRLHARPLMNTDGNFATNRLVYTISYITIVCDNVIVEVGPIWPVMGNCIVPPPRSLHVGHPLTRGSASGSRCMGLCPQTSVIGSRYRARHAPPPLSSFWIRQCIAIIAIIMHRGGRRGPNNSILSMLYATSMYMSVKWVGPSTARWNYNRKVLRGPAVTVQTTEVMSEGNSFH